MKTFDLTHDTLGSFQKRVLDFQHKLEQRSPIHFNLHINAATLKPVKHYLTEAISEGLKSNLLGNDINMEFLMLTIRSYSGLLYNTIADQIGSRINFTSVVTDQHELVS